MPVPGPLLWDDCDAQGAEASVGHGKGKRIEPDWGESAQTAPDDWFDQHTEG